MAVSRQIFCFIVLGGVGLVQRYVGTCSVGTVDGV